MKRALQVAGIACLAVTAGCLGIRGTATIPLRDSVLRVNCGSAESYTDAAGNVWSADDGGGGELSWVVAGGSRVRRDDREIPGTICPGIYLTEAYGMSSYALKLPDGSYSLRLHFAETYEGITRSGQRVFSVSVNGEPVLTDFDILSEAAGPYRPTVKLVSGVRPVDGIVTVGFTPVLQNASINGIEVFRE